MASSLPCLARLIRQPRPLRLAWVFGVLLAAQSARAQGEAAPEAPPPAEAAVGAAETPAAAEPVPASADAPAPPRPTEATAVPAAAGPPSPAGVAAPTSFLRLTEPEVAQRLQLSPDQRRQIEQLVVSRAESLANAPESDRPALSADFEQLFRSVLDARQMTLWNRYYSSTATTADQMRFSFRFQPWADVLSWFAERADLSLVLDAPPPGTFNYTDNRVYTTAEALDLLNGVLMTKGYSLVRRERMLLVLNLAVGVPSELIPQVTLEELDERGKFELVSVLFDIGKRPAEEVSAEIKPLLGSYGKSSPLPKTGQILVTETAGKMRSIRAIIDSIPEPSSPRPERPSEPEKPTLASYELGNLAPGTVLEVLKAVLPDAKLAHDSNTGKLVAFAVASHQAAIAATLEEMRSDLPADRRPVLEQHRVRGISGADALTFLAPLLPEARLTWDSQRGRLVAWAKPADQQSIRESLETLSGQAGEGSPPQVVVYPLTRAEPSAITSLLSTLVPLAKVVADPRSRSIVALASAEEQATIRATLDQLEAEDPDQARRAVVYPLTTADPSAVSQVLGTLLPGVKVIVESKAKRLVAWGLPAEQEQVRSIIEQMDRELEPGQQLELRTHPLGPVEPSAALNALRLLVPDAQVLSGGQPGTIVAWALPRDHALIEETLGRLHPELPETVRPRLEVYPTGKANPSVAVSVLTPLFPQARLTYDSAANQVLAWASPEDQAEIAAAIARMQEDEGDDTRRTMAAYHVVKERSANVASLLQSTVTTAIVRSEPTSGKILVWARPDEQRTIREAIESLEAEVTAEPPRELAVYPLDGRDASSLINALQPILPEVKFSSDTKAGKLLAWVLPEERQRIDAALAQLARDAPVAKLEGRVYPLKLSDPYAAYQTLRSLWPSISLTIDTRANTVLVVAAPEDHEAIGKLIAQIDQPQTTVGGQQLAVYPMGGRDPSAMVSLLQSSMSDARFVADTRGGNLLVWARPEQQKLVAENLRQLEEKFADSRATTEVYRFQHADPNAAFAVLRQLLPSVPMAPDLRAGTLLVTAAPAEHAQLRAAIEAMDAGGPAAGSQQLAVYPLGGRDPSALVSLLQPALPDARLVADTRSGNLLVWARPEQQELLRQNLEMLTSAGAETELSTRVYRFRQADPSVAIGVLRPLFPTAPMAVDLGARTLVATAMPDQHEQIAATIDQMETAADAGGDHQLVTYDTQAADPSNLLSVVRGLFSTRSDVRVTADAKAGKLIVWGRPEDQAQVAQLVRDLEGETSVDNAPQIEVYALGASDSEAVIRVLRQLVERYPDAQIVEDEQANQIVALARPAVQATIRATIEQLQTSAPQAEVFQLEQLEAISAEFAISRLFGAEGRRDSSAPKIDSDPDRQQLLVRGTRQQLEEIRNLLVKMGESGLAPSEGPTGRGSDGRQRNVRVIPWAGGTDPQSLEELSRLWSQLRENPVRVVTPSAVVPTWRGRGATDSENAPEATLVPDEQPPAPADAEAPPGSGGGADPVVTPVPDAGVPENSVDASAEEPGRPSVQANPDEQAAEGAAPVAQGLAPVPPTQPQSAADEHPAPPADLPAPTRAPEPAAPIIVAPGDGTLTIASDDLEALDAFEELLRHLANPGAGRGRDFTVFALEHVDAVAIADTLQKFFEDRSFGFSSAGAVRIVPDRRLNVIVVRASQNDLATIGGLLRVLDSPEVATPLVGSAPRRIEIRNTKASEVALVLRDVYQTQLRSGGAARQLSLPSGLSREFASLISQINQANAGPELSLAVDDNTNSLIVRAEPALFSEVAALAQAIDEAALNSERSVRVLSLKRTNTETLQSTLDWLLGQSPSSRGRSRRSLRYRGID